MSATFVCVGEIADFLLILLTLVGLLFILRRKHEPRPRGRTRPQVTAQRGGLYPPKPEWVGKEVFRLKALMPEAGCRRIEIVFNRLHRDRRGMTVSKSWVASLMRKSQEEVLRKRREIRRRRPRPMPRNIVWGLDLTFVSADEPPILGILDHGSRACLELEQVESKRTVTLLRCLLQIIEQFGKPKVMLTDNEAMFRSRLFRWSLALIGIRHQLIAPFAPWQNGRIERFFGTFKAALRRRADCGVDTVPNQADLDHFRAWYNFVRSHQNLDGLTPAEAWSGKELNRKRRAWWFSDWNGALAGYFWRPG